MHRQFDMHNWLLDWLSERTTTRILGSLIVIPLLGTAWLFWRAARCRAPFRKMWITAAWCITAFCPIPLSVAWAPPALQNAARVVFIAVAAFGWWRLYRTLPALLRFPMPYEAGAICANLLHDVDEIVEGRRARGVVEDPETTASIAHTRSQLNGLLAQMREANGA